MFKNYDTENKLKSMQISNSNIQIHTHLPPLLDDVAALQQVLHVVVRNFGAVCFIGLRRESGFLSRLQHAVRAALFRITGLKRG